MASLFDPRAFIEAERRERSQTLAAAASDCDPAPAPTTPQKSADPVPDQGEHSQQSQQSQPLGPQWSPWLDGPRLLESYRRPPNIDKSKWRRLVHLAKWTTEDWATSLQDLGWHPLEIFGCNPDPRAGRLDRNGLVRTMLGLGDAVEIVAVNAVYIELSIGRDALRYRAFGPRGQVYLWEAYAPKGGP